MRGVKEGKLCYVSKGFSYLDGICILLIKLPVFTNFLREMSCAKDQDHLLSCSTDDFFQAKNLVN